MSTIKVVGIQGSSYTECLTQQVLATALQECQRQNAETEMIHLVECGLPYYDGRRDATAPESVEPLLKKITEADGLILATPTRWFNVSDRMKAFLEWLTPLNYRSFALQGKAAALMAVCEEDGAQQALVQMAAPLIHSGCVIPPFCMYFFNKNTAGTSEHDWQETDKRLIASNLLAAIRAFRSLGPYNWNSIPK